MYRIEVGVGEETVFRTIEELATGIRNGLITPRSRIFHAASQKWLPIEFHPHYKKALDLVTGGAPMIDTGLTRPVPASRRTPVPAPQPRAEEIPAPAPRLAEPSAPAPRRAEPPASSPRAAAPVPFPPPAPRAAVPSPAPASAPSPARTPTSAPAPITAPTTATSTPAPALAPAPYRRTFEGPPPEVELPKVSYPEVPPSAGAMPVARRRKSGPGPFVVGGLAAVALVGSYFLLPSLGIAARADRAAAAVPAADSVPIAELPQKGPEPTAGPRTMAEAPGPLAPVSEPTLRVAGESAPTRSVSTATSAPASAAASTPVSAAKSAPAPALQQAPRPTGPVSQAWSSSAGAIAPLPAPAPAKPAPVPESPQITPPPAALDLSLPQLPIADTLVTSPRTQRDSAAIKRILRAVTGGAPSPKADR